MTLVGFKALLFLATLDPEARRRKVAAARKRIADAEARRRAERLERQLAKAAKLRKGRVG